MTRCKALMDLFEKQGRDRVGCHSIKAFRGPNILTGYKRKCCSSTDRCLARNSDEGKEKDEETSEKKSSSLFSK